jgi:deoxycytidine triphosphate deaminase
VQSHCRDEYRLCAKSVSGNSKTAEKIMILSGQEIKNRSQLPMLQRLISPFIERNVRRSSYDLTVGDEYYCGGAGMSTTAPLATHRLATSQLFSIPAHGICYILCGENIDLPINLTAKVSLRMKHIFGGLILTSQPPFDPGYCGKVIVMLHNLSSADFALKQGERIATIEFSQVFNPLLTVAAHHGVVNLSSELTQRVSSSLVQIYDEAKSAKAKVDLFINHLIGFASLLVAIAAIPSILSSLSLKDQISDQKIRLDELDKVVKEQKGLIETLQKQSLQESGEAVNTQPSIGKTRVR